MIAASYFEQVESARTPQDLFNDPDKARSTYRRLARLFHPDHNPGDDRAEAAFAQLSAFWAEYNGHAPSTTAQPNSNTGVVFETKRHVFVGDDLLAKGDISNVYRVEYTADGSTKTAVVKMPRSPKNNDLVAHEIDVLKILNSEVEEQYRPFHSTTVDSFSHRDKTTGKTRKCVVLEDLDGFVSLADVLSAYPNGIHTRHVAWIARRLFVAMDTAHRAGIVHSAVFPEHVMIHPADHGVVLVDWSYAAKVGEKIKSAVPKYVDKGWYGKSYQQPVDHRIDVRQAAHTLEALLGSQEARPYRAFFNGCRVASTPPAGELFQEFDEMLTRLYGKRTFIPFEMPQGWKRDI